VNSGDLSLIVRDAHSVFTEHRTIAVVAWVGVVVAVLLSAALSLLGTSIRASVVTDLELAFRNATLVQSGTLALGKCPLAAMRCDGRPTELSERTSDALRIALGFRNVGELDEWFGTLTAPHIGKMSARMLAVDDAWFSMQPVRWESGRGFSFLERGGGRHVVIIGQKLADSLSSARGEPPAFLGLDGQRYEVIGVVSSGITAITSMDNAVIVPRSRHGLADGVPTRRSLLVRTGEGLATTSRTELEGVLRQVERLGPRDSLGLSVQGLEEQVGLVDDVWTLLNASLWRLAMLLAATASVGVGALQFTVASARQHELGVRKAVGARRRQLVWSGVAGSLYFMLVACGTGGVMALIVAWSIALTVGATIEGIVAALVLGIAPVMVFGALAGGLAYAYYARMRPAALLGHSL
jgi:putative ABC transport system permease protein